MVIKRKKIVIWEQNSKIKLNDTEVSVVGFSATQTQFTGVLPKNISPQIINDAMTKQGSAGFTKSVKKGGEQVNFGTMSVNKTSYELHELSDEIANAVEKSIQSAAN